MLNVVERWCSIPFKKEMLLVGWTTTLPAFCWATNVKRCWTVAHWLIGLTQMTKASVKTDYFNKCGLRPDTLRLNLQIKEVKSNFLITWWLDLFRTERNLCFCLMLTSRILQMMRDVMGYRECLSIHLLFNHSERPSSKWQRSNSLGEPNFLTFNRSLYCLTCFRPTGALFQADSMFSECWCASTHSLEKAFWRPERVSLWLGNYWTLLSIWYVSCEMIQEVEASRRILEI